MMHIYYLKKIKVITNLRCQPKKLEIREIASVTLFDPQRDVRDLEIKSKYEKKFPSRQKVGRNVSEICILCAFISFA